VTPRPTFRVPLEDIRFPEPVAAGMNYLTLGSLAHMMRATNEDPPPVVVTKEPNGGGFRIVDGRHRVVAAMIAGRKDIACRL
jgi:hypothetical protein